MRLAARALTFVLVVFFAHSLARAAENEQVASAIKEFITSGQMTLANQTDDQRLFQIFTFYEGRDYKPIWTRDSGVKAKGKVLLKVLKAAEEYGLDPADYSIADIETRIGSTNPEELAELDLIMSDVFADFGRDVGQGRVLPTQASRQNHIEVRGPGPLNLIDGAELADDLEPYVKSLEPKSPQYARLKEKLAQYRAIAAMGGWPKVPEGATLKPGADDPRVPVLRKTLSVMGDFTGNAEDSATLYDEPLVAAVKRFQERHGLTDDGVIGPGTLKVINVPVEDRIQLMVINLERRRWMLDDLGSFYVFANLADAYLKVVRDEGDREKTIHVARLVVGKPFTSTPVFSENMSYVVFNPNWGVPASIANNEYLPKLRSDPGYLARQNIRIIGSAGEVNPYTVNWSGMSRMPYQLRQDSGDGNALGRLKFMFPNKFNVYIHDTPSKSLFAKESRYFSHGCMRVQDPEALAAVLLQDQGWTPAKIKAQIASGKQRIVNLDIKVPVHITYLTAWVNKDGEVNFRPDVYSRDKQLAALLVKKS
ncbi:MAG: murein L,D-transpeptidase [Parvibaculaceae bacterium]